LSPQTDNIAAFKRENKNCSWLENKRTNR